MESLNYYIKYKLVFLFLYFKTRGNDEIRYKNNGIKTQNIS